jgi:hypothetical protein
MHKCKQQEQEKCSNLNNINFLLENRNGGYSELLLFREKQTADMNSVKTTVQADDRPTIGRRCGYG